MEDKQKQPKNEQKPFAENTGHLYSYLVSIAQNGYDRTTASNNNTTKRQKCKTKCMYKFTQKKKDKKPLKTCI